MSAARVAVLLSLSGMCALIYQTVWLRDFRLIFGGSTAATAAVLAIFMGGLGLGGALLGKTSDLSKRPLRFYAMLEFGITVSAALSPLLLWLVRQGYVGVGGTLVMGVALGTVVRLLLSAVVLAVPTLLMGGTLPAAARSVEFDEDGARRRVALLYGANTLGAVVGTVLSSFYLIETFGNHTTLWMAAAVNAVVAAAAWMMGGREVEVAPEASVERAEATAPPRLVFAAAGLVGLAFFLMEMVWYRMLAPILGGTAFTFGLILALALLGVGLGGFVYAFLGERVRPTAWAFGLTCALEALFLAIPFAIGDHLAIMELLLRSLRSLGFGGLLYAWTVVAVIVVLPASLVAGFQFPMLIAMLGRGGEDVGRHTGTAYAWNTLGAIVGLLAGGFGLQPLLEATGVWRLVTALLALLSLASCWQAFRAQTPSALPLRIASPVTALLALLLLLTWGPGAVWRQTPIGAGRSDRVRLNPRSLEAFAREQRGRLIWQADGLETCVGLRASEGGYGFLVNGKSDGNSRDDAGTQVLSGLLGAMRMDPKKILVIGLGTGSTAGWLGAFPGVERVDVMELEPIILRVAKDCTPVNQNVLTNPKVHITLADGRETMITSREKYDLIVSEPSNPYRAGVAALFTRQYYDSALPRLNEGGVFCQWLQGYEVSLDTVRTFYNTFSSVFPYVETWSTQGTDLLLVGSLKPIPFDVAEMRKRIQQPPYGDAIRKVWRVDDLEGVLAHHLAGQKFKEEMRQGAGINTDDKNLLEFGFARSVGRETSVSLNALQERTAQLGELHPQVVNGEVDWNRVECARDAATVMAGGTPRVPDQDRERGLRALAMLAWREGNASRAVALWKRQSQEPSNPFERMVLASAMSMGGDDGALDQIRAMKKDYPVEADAIAAVYYYKKGEKEPAAAAIERSFTKWHATPWPPIKVMEPALQVAAALGSRDAGLAPRMLGALAEPFPLHALDRERILALIQVNRVVDRATAVALLESFGPDFPWNEGFLKLRVATYPDGDPRKLAAQRDLEKFMGQ
ncbi:MAG: spermidine synthase [Armatimonadetes bacterium]|nr:spermidine synthase [Armatimonadota bacterium]